MIAERRALFDALLEAEARSKGLVFRPVAIGPIGSPDPDLIFVAQLGLVGVRLLDLRLEPCDDRGQDGFVRQCCNEDNRT